MVIIRFLSKVFQAIDRILCLFHFKHPTVVVSLDGGICSQIFNYCKGARFVKTGCNVLFDIRWFALSGKDVDGRFLRTYELQEMFPTLPIKIVSAKRARYWYARFFKHNTLAGLVDVHDIKRDTYLGSQYEPDMDSYKEILPLYFNQKTMQSVAIPWDVNDGLTHCGVHVRRGDLAKGNLPGYGMVSDNYFINAIQYVQHHYPDVVFHFFSDELDWVEQNIIPNISADYDLIKGNKAWEDLALLSKCNVIVASQGSFGRMAAQLREHAELIICKSDLKTKWAGADTNITLID